PFPQPPAHNRACASWARLRSHRLSPAWAKSRRRSRSISTLACRRARSPKSLPIAGPTGYIWKLPEITMLERSTEAEINDDDLRNKALKIEETLLTFG